MYLNHITLTTGHLARTSRGDVPAEVTAVLAPWLQGLVDSGKAAPLPVPALSEYSAQALLQDGALVVTLYAPAGPYQPGKPHGGNVMPLVTIGVAHRSRHAAQLWDALCAAVPRRPKMDMPAAPWLAVITHPTLAAHLGATEWLGDLERCVAWAVTPSINACRRMARWRVNRLVCLTAKRPLCLLAARRRWIFCVGPSFSVGKAC